MDNFFDCCIGVIEDLVVGEEFQNLINHFKEDNYLEFEPETSENKITYTDIYNNYINLIETYLVENLQRRIAGFDMELFVRELESRKDQLDGEIFELLYTLTDFVAFKTEMVEFRDFKEGRVVDLSTGISITAIEPPAKNANGSIF